MKKQLLFKALGITILSVGILGVARTEVQAENVSTNQASIAASVDASKGIDLFDLSWEKDSTVGYGNLEIAPADLTVRGVKKHYDKALQAHAPSSIIYDVSKYSSEYDRFISLAGINAPSWNSTLKFIISVSNDGISWEKKYETNIIQGNDVAVPIDVSISGAKYLKLEADEGTDGNGSDHAVYVEPHFVKVDATDTQFKTVDEYADQLKGLSASDAVNKNSNTLFAKKFMELVGYENLQYASDTGDDDIVNMAKIILNDDELLQYFVNATKEGSGSYIDILSIMSDIYSKYPDDLKDNAHASLYKRMLVAMGFVFGSPDGYKSQQNGGRETYYRDPVTRYGIYKDLYLNNKLANTKQYGNLPTDLLMWVFNVEMDDNEILWFNDYAHNHLNPDGSLNLGGYGHMNYQDHWEYGEEYFDPANETKWNDKYGFEKYGIKYGVKGDIKLWMIWEAGGICGPISNASIVMESAFGIPARLCHQPGHAPSFSYYPDKDGNSSWQIETSVNGFDNSFLYYDLPLKWGLRPWEDSKRNASYLWLTQEALDDYDNLVKVQAYLELAAMYKSGTDEYEAILEKAMDVQNFNLDVYDLLITSYKKNPHRTNADYIALAKKIVQNFKNYPTTFVDLLNYLSEGITDEMFQVEIDFIRNTALDSASKSTDVSSTGYDPNEMANYYLGNVDNTVASFNFDGKDKNKIILNKKYKNLSFQTRYSLDGGKTFKQTDKKEIQLTDDEIAHLNSSDDILVGFMGANTNYKIDLSKEEPDFDEKLIQVNDQENRFVGDMKLLNKLECSVDDGKTWQILDPKVDGTKFSGDVSVKLRKRNNERNVLESKPVEKEFKFQADADDEDATYIPFSEITVKETLGSEADKDKIIDGIPTVSSSWTADRNNANGVNDYVILELKHNKYLSKLDYYSREDSSLNGRATEAKIYTSEDGKNWTEVAHPTNWDEKKAKNTVSFKPTFTKYVKFEGIKESGGWPNLVISQLNLYESKTEANKAPKVKAKDVQINQGDPLSIADCIENIDGNTDFSNYKMEWASTLDTFSKNGKYNPRIKIVNTNGYATVIEPNVTLKGKNSIDLYSELDTTMGTIVLDKTKKAFHVASSYYTSMLNEAKSTDEVVTFTLFDSNYKEKQTIAVLGSQTVNDMKKMLENLTYDNGDFLVVHLLEDKHISAFGETGAILEKQDSAVEEQFEIKNDQLIRTEYLTPVVQSQDVTVPLGKMITPNQMIKEINHSSDFKDMKIEFANEPDMFETGKKEISIKVTNRFGHTVESKANLTITDVPTITMIGWYGSAQSSQERLKVALDPSEKKLNVITDSRDTQIDSGNEKFGTISLLNKDLKVKKTVSINTTEKPEILVQALNGIPYEDGDYLEYNLHAENRVKVTNNSDIILNSEDSGRDELIQIKNGKFVRIDNLIPKVNLKAPVIDLGSKIEPKDFIDSVDTIGTDYKAEYVQAPDMLHLGDQDVTVRVTNSLGIKNEVTTKLHIESGDSITILGYYGERRIGMNCTNGKLSMTQDPKETPLESGDREFATITIYDKDLKAQKSVSVRSTDTPQVLIDKLDGSAVSDGGYIGIKMYQSNRLQATSEDKEILSADDAKALELIQYKNGHFVRSNTSPDVKLKEATIQIGQKIKVEDFIDTVDTVGQDYKAELITKPNMIQLGEQDIKIRVTNSLGEVKEATTKLHIESGDSITILGYNAQHRIGINCMNGKLSLTQDLKETPLESEDREFATITVYNKNLEEQASVTARSTDKPQTIIDKLDNVPIEDGGYISLKMYQENRLIVTSEGKEIVPAADAKKQELIQYKNGHLIHADNTPTVELKEATVQVGQKISAKDFVNKVDVLGVNDKNYKAEFVDTPDMVNLGDKDVKVRITDFLGGTTEATTKLHVENGDSITILGYHGQRRVGVNCANGKLSLTQDSRNTPMEGGDIEIAAITVYSKELKEQASASLRSTDYPQAIIDKLDNTPIEDGGYISFTMYQENRLVVTSKGDEILPSDKAKINEVVQYKDDHLILVDETVKPTISSDSAISYKVGETVSKEKFLQDIHYKEQPGMSVSTDFSDALLAKAGTQKVTITSVNPASKESVTKEVTVTIEDNNPVEDIVQSKDLNDCQWLITAVEKLTGKTVGKDLPKSALKTIEKIEVSGQKLTGSIPSSIGLFTGLKVLDLSNNQLNGEIPSAFTQLSNLTELNLSDNEELSGTLPASQLKALSIVKIAETSLTIDDLQGSSINQNSSDFENSLVDTTSGKHLKGNATISVKNKTIQPFKPTAESYFNLQYVLSNGQTKALLPSDRVKIFEKASNKVVYEGVIDENVSFAYGSTSNVADYQVVLDNLDNQKNTVFTVSVKLSTPNIQCDNQVIVEKGEVLSQDEFFKAIHLVLEQGQTASTDLSKVDFSKAGKYTVTIKVKDQNNQEATKDVIVEVKDQNDTGDYADATHATGKVLIDFLDDSTPTDPVDPADPTKPIHPVDPINPVGGELMISYASKLEFGLKKKSDTEIYAKADKIQITDGKGGTKEEMIAPIISVKDVRGTERKGWNLTAKVDGPFKDTNGNELVGAELTFDHMYSGSGQAGAPQVSKTTKLTTTDTEIASADATEGVGNWSIGLGQLQGSGKETTDGVKLSVPQGSSKNEDIYKTTVTYTLTAEP